ncbi:hypothetical protein [Streptomyces sp. Act143]|uniref:hypothetical protein n=1 Tax=Streptomyces sp. Act143 TaxID=2200760 RepID=UPI00215AA8FE|nr:hypothetical protein [Streptomyces sp. Act143]
MVRGRGGAHGGRDHLARYRHEEKLPFGAAVQLPDPVNITLETEPLEEFAD